MNQIPPITKNLLIINVLMYMGTVVAKSSYGIDLSNYLGLHFFLSQDFNPIQIFTYMFMHGGLSHLFFNMFALWMFGRTLEYIWGPKRFLTFYLVCGIGAGLIQELATAIHYYTQVANLPPEAVEIVVKDGANALHNYMNFTNRTLAILNSTLNGVSIGASGCIFGILLGFGMLFPDEKMFVFPLPFPIKAKFFVMGYAVIELLLGLSNNPSDNVAHFAHLGGMIFGFFLILYWKNKRKNNGFYYN